MLAFAHEAHRERDPVGARSCAVRFGGRRHTLPRVQLPYQFTCCCQEQCNGSMPAVLYGDHDSQQPPPTPPRSPQPPPPYEQQRKPGAPPGMQLVPIDAACSTAGSSTGRGSGSGRGERGSSSQAAQPYQPPAPEGIQR